MAYLLLLNGLNQYSRLIYVDWFIAYVCRDIEPYFANHVCCQHSNNKSDQSLGGNIVLTNDWIC